MSNIKISFAFIFIIVITIFILYKVQFINQEADQYTNKEIVNTSKKVDDVPVIGTTLGLFDEKTALSKSNTTFNLANSNSFQPYISIQNRDTKENLFRLFFILDYQQQHIQYNKNQVNYIDVLLKPNEKRKINIKLKSLPFGEGP